MLLSKSGRSEAGVDVSSYCFIIGAVRLNVSAGPRILPLIDIISTKLVSVNEKTSFKKGKGPTDSGRKIQLLHGNLRRLE
jgi:hypothetical protein